MTVKKILPFLLLLIAVCNFAFAQYDQNLKPEKKKRKIVFIAGPDSHGKGEHEYKGGVTFLAQKIKEGMPEMDTVVYHNGWPKDQNALKDANTIILFCDGSEGHIAIPHLKELEELMNKGTGLVMLHFTLEIPKGADADKLRDLIGGYFETGWSVNPFWTPDITHLPDHPVTRGVKPFAIRDEWYYHMRFVNNMNHITPILQVLPPDSTLNRPEGAYSNNKHVRKAILEKKEPQVIAWTYERPGGGRGFGFTGGHIHANWKNDSFRMLVLNAIVWTAKAQVPQEGILTKTPDMEELDKLTKPAQ